VLQRLLAAKGRLLAVTFCLSAFVLLVGVGADLAPKSGIPLSPSTIEASTVSQPVTAVGQSIASSPVAMAALSSVASPPTTVPRLQVKGAPVAAVFVSSIMQIDEGLRKQLLENKIWTAGAPVSLDQLRVLQISYWNFEGQIQTGRLIVNQAWAVRLSTVFKALFQARFPMRRMDPLAAAVTAGAAAVSDNTRSFQSRRVNGRWSMHAYGLAVDINPAENPWVRGASVIPTAGARFADRSVEGPGLVKPGSVVVKAFKAIGWTWGGTWNSSKDYMHFSSNGH
jgi:hypothetical protein